MQQRQLRKTLLENPEAASLNLWQHSVPMHRNRQ